jgi:hypothetical protein
MTDERISKRLKELGLPEELPQYVYDRLDRNEGFCMITWCEKVTEDGIDYLVLGYKQMIYGHRVYDKEYFKLPLQEPESENH